MLSKLIQFSLDRAALVLVLAAALLVWAGARLPQVPVDVFPELNAPTVVIMAEAGGLAADEVEQYVTFPMETAVNGIPGVRRVRTSSAIGLSIAYVEFEWGTDIYRARQLVGERLDAVRESLPPETHAEMTPITSITGEIMLLALSSPGGETGDLELRAFAEYDLRNRVLAIPGVAQISVIGGELPEYRVSVQQERLRLYDLTVQDVVDAAYESHSTLSAGYLPDVDGMELPIRQSGKVRGIADIAGTVVKYHDGAPVTIGQVADVALAPAPKRGTGADAGSAAVVMTVQKAPGTNTLNVTEQIDAMLDDTELSLPASIVLNRDIFRQADFIDLSVTNVVHALRDAAIIVSVILVLFLLNVRTTVITLTALPLSLAIGLLALDALGMSINVMTLGGLAIAVGSLVDDAIIDVENVFRRLNQNGALPEDQRQPRLKVILDASNEIRPAMVFATIIIALVFLPLMFLGGIEGRFFRPLGVAFVVSILASLLVALTVTPAMCRYMLREPKKNAGHGERESFLGALAQEGLRADRACGDPAAVGRAGQCRRCEHRGAVARQHVRHVVPAGVQRGHVHRRPLRPARHLAPGERSHGRRDREPPAPGRGRAQRHPPHRPGRARRARRAGEQQRDRRDGEGRLRQGRGARPDHADPRTGAGHHDQRRPADRAPPEPHPLRHARRHRHQRLRRRPRRPPPNRQGDRGGAGAAAGGTRRGGQPRGDDPVAAGGVPPERPRRLRPHAAVGRRTGAQRPVRRDGRRGERGRAAVRPDRAPRRRTPRQHRRPARPRAARRGRSACPPGQRRRHRAGDGEQPHHPRERPPQGRGITQRRGGVQPRPPRRSRCRRASTRSCGSTATP